MHPIALTFSDRNSSGPRARRRRPTPPPPSLLVTTNPTLPKIRIGQPHLFEGIDRHGTVTPRRIGRRDTAVPEAPKDHEVIVAVGLDGHHDRRPLDQILERQFAVTDPRVAPLLDVALQIQWGKFAVGFSQGRGSRRYSSRRISAFATSRSDTGSPYW